MNPPAEFRGDGHAVGARSVWDGANKLGRIRIQDFHLRRVRDVNAPSRFIDGDVVPATRAGNRHFLDDVISDCGAARGAVATKLRIATKQ